MYTDEMQAKHMDIRDRARAILELNDEDENLDDSIRGFVTHLTESWERVYKTEEKGWLFRTDSLGDEVHAVLKLSKQRQATKGITPTVVEVPAQRIVSTTLYTVPGYAVKKMSGKTLLDRVYEGSIDPPMEIEPYADYRVRYPSRPNYQVVINYVDTAAQSQTVEAFLPKAGMVVVTSQRVEVLEPHPHRKVRPKQQLATGRLFRTGTTVYIQKVPQEINFQI